MTKRDNCEACHGEKGGVPGNENRIKSGDSYIVLCDFCTIEHMSQIREFPKPKKKVEEKSKNLYKNRDYRDNIERYTYES